MKHVIAVSSFAVVLALSTGRMNAQSTSEIAGWGGLMLTPVGALTPMGPAIVADTSPFRVQLRYGHWQFASDDENTHNVGLGWGIRTGQSRTTLEFAYSQQANCSNCSVWMFGADVDVPLTPPPSASSIGWRLALNPTFGIARPDGGTAASVAVSLPLSAAVPLSPQWTFAPFISPGYGYGVLSGEGDSEGGTRPMLAGGVTFTGTQSPLRVTVSARKIFLDGAPTVIGLGLSFAP